METLSPEDHYSPKHLKRKLLEDFDGRIMISNVNGKQDVVTFVTTAAFILDNFHDNQNKNIDSIRERMEIVKTAAEIIRNDVKSLQSDLTKYPSTTEIVEHDSVIPDTLSLFLSNLITYKNSNIQKSAIGQALIQNIRPKSFLSPMQLGLSVTLHRYFGSRYLMDTCFTNLGFVLLTLKFNVSRIVLHTNKTQIWVI